MLTIPPWRKRSSRPTTDYTYRSLDAQRNEVRLLKIEPSLRLKVPIVCNLRVVSLDDESIPKYCALSYCLCNSTANRPIECGGSIIRITGDLLDALRSLRKLTMTLVWIDQICIYSDRSRIKHCRNLRFDPLFSEGFNFAYLVDPLQSGARW